MQRSRDDKVDKSLMASPAIGDVREQERLACFSRATQGLCGAGQLLAGAVGSFEVRSPQNGPLLAGKDLCTHFA